MIQEFKNGNFKIVEVQSETPYLFQYDDHDGKKYWPKEETGIHKSPEMADIEGYTLMGIWGNLTKESIEICSFTEDDLKHVFSPSKSTWLLLSKKVGSFSPPYPVESSINPVKYNGVKSSYRRCRMCEERQKHDEEKAENTSCVSCGWCGLYCY